MHRDHGFHAVALKRVVRETAEASSFVLDIPDELRSAFEYRAGQFCTFRFSIDGQQFLRCYSMSSSPTEDDEFQVTVKRVAGGAVSNWMNDELTAGDILDVTLPAGVFCPADTDRELVAFAGGSGITPVFSILKTVLAQTARRVRLLYANRDAEAVIFAREIDQLAERYAGRFEVTHHFDVEKGFIDEPLVRTFYDRGPDAEFFICGPGPFMDLIERTLLDAQVEGERIRIERFTPLQEAEPASAPGSSAETRVTIEIGGRSGVADYRAGTTVLQTARQLGLSPPFSCESGSCATCMARLVEGTVSMHVNNALTEDEVAEGWILTCQSVPTSTDVHVVYE
jgi:3-ketosteroid 9alpha-monooxygenase subunit B